MERSNDDIDPDVFLHLVRAIQIARTNGGKINKDRIHAAVSAIEKICPNGGEHVSPDLPVPYLEAVQGFVVRNNRRQRTPTDYLVFCEMRALARRMKQATCAITSEAREQLERDTSSLFDRLKNAQRMIRRAA